MTNNKILAQNYTNSLKIIYQPIRARVNYNLDNINRLLLLLNNPQNKIKSIHIAGTSGKGSTAIILSSILKSQGYKVGTTLSPHILDIRERIQIGSKPIAKNIFSKYFFEILPSIQKVNRTSKNPVSFFEMITALAFYTFYKERVDYAVIEVGLGGTLCATNTISREDKVNIINKIGLDHTNILGKTLKAIAGQKAGIIHKNQLTITCKQTKIAQSVIKIKCLKENSRLIILNDNNGEINKKVFLHIAIME